MLALLCCCLSMMMMMMMMMMSDATSAEVIRLHSGEAVQLSPNLTGAGLTHGKDFRWTHPNVVVTLKNATCGHGRCELLADGSLRFSRVQNEDSGNYRLQVFDPQGIRLQVMNFVLQVGPANSSSGGGGGGGGGSSSIMVSMLCCFFLLVFFIIIILFVLMRRMRRRRRRRSQRTAIELMHDDVYVVMHSSHGNKSKEESHYVTGDPLVSVETADTQQVGAVEEDIYV